MTDKSGNKNSQYEFHLRGGELRDFTIEVIKVDVSHFLAQVRILDLHTSTLSSHIFSLQNTKFLGILAS
jgi:hypothetical protein